MKSNWAICLPRDPDAELLETARRIGERLTSREWLDLPGRRPAERKIKIAEGLYLLAQQTAGRGYKTVLVRDGIAEEIMTGLIESAQSDAACHGIYGDTLRQGVPTPKGSEHVRRNDSRRRMRMQTEKTDDPR